MTDPDPTDAVHEAIDLGQTWRLGPGDRIRDWVLGEPIGRGGSSVVFEATRADAGFEQRAALKLLRTVLVDERFVGRFDRERRILLALRHSNIVRLLDGGSTTDGVPWYAMERIDGEPLTTWSEGRPVEERLRALISVCRAVDFAHQRLVVHCDLKPENVLVDADGEPHVLDFGIGRLLDEQERTATLRMATPRWAAPEQLDGGPLTTATDVHALGLMLWATLTSRVPREGLTGKALLAACGEPLSPPSGFEPACRGDLDAIVLRATAPETSDRYRSAGELAEDLRRHLDGEAVLALEGVAWYRASRWMRRNRGLVAGLVLGVLVLVGWAVTTTAQSSRIRSERDRAEATLDLLVGMLEAADPAHARGEELTVREVLESGVRELDLEARDPSLAGEVRVAVGRVQAAIGETVAARESMARALEQLRAVYPETHPAVLRARLHLAHADFVLDRDKPAAVSRVQALLVELKAAGSIEDLAAAHLLLAEMHAELGSTAAAIEQAELAREAFLTLGQGRHAARALAIRGYVEAVGGDPEGSERMTRALDETVSALGTRLHPDVADILHELAVVTVPPEPALFEESIALRRELYGPGWVLASALNNYALVLEPSDPERAAAVLQEASDMAAAARGASHPDALRIAVNHGAVLLDAGRVSDALEILRRVDGEPGLPEDLRARVRSHIQRAPLAD